MRKLQVVLAILMLLLGLTFFNIKNVYASYNTPVQTVTYETFAKMGTTTQYSYTGPSGNRYPVFYSALIASGSQGGGWVYQPDKIRIEVTGVYPNGNPLEGYRFSGRTVLSSPDDSDVEQQILKIVYDTLVYTLPSGLKSVLKNTETEGGATTDYDAEKAWAEWCGFVGLHMEKGLKFGYHLDVDPALEGTYTINIHYLAEIWRHCREGGWYETTLHLYDTITYEYVNTPPPPSTPSGRTSGYVGVSYSYSTSTTDPNGDSLRYQFYWGDGSYTLTGWYTSGATASASHSWSSTGYKYVKVRAQDSTGAWSDWSPSLTVYISSSGGGGCPTLFVWDGTAYAEEGILDIHAESDVTVQRQLQNTLALEDGAYKLELRELDNFTSHIDQVKLYAVDYQGEWHLCPLIYAYHNELGKVKHTLRFDDENRVDLKPTETISLEFAQPIPYGETAYFIFEINGYNAKPHPM